MKSVTFSIAAISSALHLKQRWQIIFSFSFSHHHGNYKKGEGNCQFFFARKHVASIRLKSRPLKAVQHPPHTGLPNGKMHTTHIGRETERVVRNIHTTTFIDKRGEENGTENTLKRECVEFFLSLSRNRFSQPLKDVMHPCKVLPSRWDPSLLHIHAIDCVERVLHQRPVLLDCFGIPLLGGGDGG